MFLCLDSHCVFPELSRLLTSASLSVLRLRSECGGQSPSGQLPSGHACQCARARGARRGLHSSRGRTRCCMSWLEARGLRLDVLISRPVGLVSSIENKCPCSVLKERSQRRPGEGPCVAPESPKPLTLKVCSQKAVLSSKPSLLPGTVQRDRKAASQAPPTLLSQDPLSPRVHTLGVCGTGTTIQGACPERRWTQSVGRDPLGEGSRPQFGPATQQVRTGEQPIARNWGKILMRSSWAEACGHECSGQACPSACGHTVPSGPLPACWRPLLPE